MDTKMDLLWMKINIILAIILGILLTFSTVSMKKRLKVLEEATPAECQCKCPKDLVIDEEHGVLMYRFPLIDKDLTMPLYDCDNCDYKGSVVNTTLTYSTDPNFRNTDSCPNCGETIKMRSLDVQ